MLGVYQNITTVLMIQNAISIIVNKIEGIDSHATCIITDANSHTNAVHLNNLPAVRGDCLPRDAFINQMQHGVTIGCSFFLVYEECTLLFLDNFHQIHDWVDEKYEKKVLVVIDTQSVLTHGKIMDILRHRIVINGSRLYSVSTLRFDDFCYFNDLPLTLLLQPNFNNEWVSIWASYPYDSYFQSYNRFFVSNHSFEYDKPIIPKIIDLNGLPVTGAFINYPPYSSYKHVPPGTGNAKLFNSSESKSILLDGHEPAILVEFCSKYNCTLTARVDYDIELWGDVFDNHTGYGLIGALAMRDANVSGAAFNLWTSWCKASQTSVMIQRAVVTDIVPKPLPLPHWQTPILPFPAYIWSCVLVSLLFGALALFIVNVGQRRINDNRLSGQETFGLFDSFYAVFSMSLFQGVSIDINFLSNITIFTAILTFALIIGNLYSGNLSSVMTVTRYERPIEGVEDVVESKFLYGGITPMWIDTFRDSDYPPHKKLIRNFIIKTIEDLRPLVTQRKIAVTVEMLQHGTLCYQSYLNKESSKYYMIMKRPLDTPKTLFMTGRTWPFMEQLNRVVFMQRESGIQYYWERRARTHLMDYDVQRNLERNGKPPEAGEPIKLSIEHILGALFLLLFGTVLATITFAFEVSLNYFSNYKLRVRKSRWR